MPPLRERREDILPLAEHFLARFSARSSAARRPARRTATRAAAALPLPGNVRELRNVLERAIVLEAGPKLELHLLETPSTRGTDAGGATFAVSGDAIPMEELERRYARWVLERSGGGGWKRPRPRPSYPTFLKRIED